MFGIVVIGRNEGERLRLCLQSLPTSAPIVYVDSGSRDNSIALAREYSAEVVELDVQKPFTAARARNAGFKRFQERFPQIEYVQFIDGDCALIASWPAKALAFLESNQPVCAVFGRRKERHPDRSIYNQLCDWEWEGSSIGEVAAFGGDVMIRATVFAELDGYRDELIAGEEPELCFRLRSAGWQIWRLDTDMTTHDACMTNLSQWWRRAMRSGYAFAQGASMHGASPEQYRIWETRRAWLWGLWIPLIGVLVVFQFGLIGMLFLTIYPLQFLRQLARNKGTLQERSLRALFQLLARFPESIGQLKFSYAQTFKQQTRIIEYK
jgi:glycosyltransferase involved in cell wall biosynthesis